MYKKFCDRCGRITKNKYAFLLASQNWKEGTYQFDGTWFGNEGVILCNNCLHDFQEFRFNHDIFNKGLIEEDQNG